MKNSKLYKLCYFTLSLILAMMFLLNASAVLIAAEGDPASTAENEEKPVYCFLGSSVTYGHTTGGVSFVDYLAKDNGWKCIKRAVSGTTLVDNGSDSYVQRMKRQISTDIKIDHFICQLSTNDASQRKPLGAVSDSKNLNDFDTSTIVGAMEYIIAYAYETWDCPVTFYTNPYYNNRYYESMIDALYELQEKWDIGIIDFYNYKDMEEVPREIYRTYMSDQIHPSAQGYRWMADEMNEYFSRQDKSVEESPSPEPSQDVQENPSDEPSDENDNESRNNTVLLIAIFATAGVIAVIVIALVVRRKK